MPPTTKTGLGPQERILAKLDAMSEDIQNTRETMIGGFATLGEQSRETARRLEEVEQVQRNQAKDYDERMRKAENKIAYFSGGAAVIAFIAGLLFK